MNQTLDTMLESLNLLAIRDVYQEVSTRIIKEQMSPIDYLQELVEQVTNYLIGYMFLLTNCIYRIYLVSI